MVESHLMILCSRQEISHTGELFHHYYPMSCDISALAVINRDAAFHYSGHLISEPSCSVNSELPFWIIRNSGGEQQDVGGGIFRIIEVRKQHWEPYGYMTFRR